MHHAGTISDFRVTSRHHITSSLTCLTSFIYHQVCFWGATVHTFSPIQWRNQLL